MHDDRMDRSLPQIAKEQNVDGVVDWAVRRPDNRVRITRRLIPNSKIEGHCSVLIR